MQFLFTLHDEMAVSVYLLILISCKIQTRVLVALAGSWHWIGAFSVVRRIRPKNENPESKNGSRSALAALQ
jgi:hypothetical protein